VRISINGAPCKPKTWRTLCHLHTKHWITLQGDVSHPQEHFNVSLIRREPELCNVQNTEEIIHHDNKKDEIINSKLPKLHLCEVITERGEKNTALWMGNGAATTHYLHHSYCSNRTESIKNIFKTDCKGIWTFFRPRQVFV